MGSALKPFYLLSHTTTTTLVLLASLGVLLPCVKTNSHYSSLVYNECLNQTFIGSTNQSHSQTLSSLFQELLRQSSDSKFFKTVGGDENLGISALFQCRSDLNNKECYNCVSTLLEHLPNSQCKQALAARIHLDGCYLKYETDGFADDQTTSQQELFHDACSEEKVVGISGFEGVRDAAFAAMESGVMNDNGFYQMDYEYLHVMAQCEGSLLGGSCDCGECVSTAVQIAQQKCGSSISGQIYLDKCFMSYTYYPDGIPGSSYQGK